MSERLNLRKLTEQLHNQFCQALTCSWGDEEKLIGTARWADGEHEYWMGKANSLIRSGVLGKAVISHTEFCIDLEQGINGVLDRMTPFELDRLASRLHETASGQEAKIKKEAQNIVLEVSLHMTGYNGEPVGNQVSAKFDTMLTWACPF